GASLRASASKPGAARSSRDAERPRARRKEHSAHSSKRGAKPYTATHPTSHDAQARRTVSFINGAPLAATLSASGTRKPRCAGNQPEISTKCTKNRGGNKVVSQVNAWPRNKNV